MCCASFCHKCICNYQELYLKNEGLWICEVSNKDKIPPFTKFSFHFNLKPQESKFHQHDILVCKLKKDQVYTAFSSPLHMPALLALCGTESSSSQLPHCERSISKPRILNSAL